MFNLSEQVQRLQLLNHSKIHGLPYKPKQQDTKVDHIDGTLYEDKAEYEHGFMIRRFKNRSKGFGLRLSKRKGQYHRPGSSNAENTRNVYSIYQEI